MSFAVHDQRHLKILRSLPWAAAAGIALTISVGLTLSPLSVKAQDAPAQKKESSGKKAELDPELIEIIAGTVDRAKKVRTRYAEKEVKELIREVTKEYKLDDAAVATLEAAGKTAVNDSLNPWWKDFESFMTTQMKRMMPAFSYDISILKNQLGGNQIDSAVEHFLAIESSRPRAQASWTKALAEVLDKKQFEGWQKGLAEELSEREKSIDKFLEDVVKTTQEKMDSEVDELIGEIVKITKAEDSLKGEIEKLAEKIGTAQLKEWREETRSVLERTRNQRWSGFARMALPMEPAEESDWDTGLKQLLAQDQYKAWQIELARIETETNERIDTLLEKSAAQQRAQIGSRMQSKLEQVIEILELDATTKKKLEEASKNAIEESLVAWKKAGRRMIKLMPKPTRESILKRSQYRFSPAGDGVAPDKQASWIKAIDSLLSPEQTATWQAEIARRAEDDAKRLADMVDATADSYQMQFEANLDPRLTDVIATLTLDEKRAGAFRKAAKKAVNQSIEAWKENAREWLEGITPEQREEYTKQGRVPLGYSNEDAPDKQPAWEEAFETILSEKDRERWEDLLAKRKDNRKDAVGGLMLILVEEWVGVGPKQWGKVAALCRKSSESLVGQLDEQHFYMNLRQIAGALKGIDDDQLRKVLNDDQWKRWEKAVTMLETRNRSRQNQQKIEDENIPPGQNPRFVENTISEMIYQRNRERKEEALLQLMAEIEIGSRHISPSPETIEQLHTGAKAAMEEVVHKWDVNFSKYARSRVKGATPKTIRQQLASVGNYSNRRDNPMETPIWKRNLSLALTPEQLKSWHEASSSREQIRNDSVANMISVYFEGRLGLGAEQGIQLRAKVAKSLEKYGPDIRRYFTSYSSPWYLQYYSIGLPLMGVPEKEIKELLTKEQFKIWEQQFQGNAANYWDNIERYHKERIEREEKEKKEKEKESEKKS